VVIRKRNVGRARPSTVTMFPPGSLRAVYFGQREQAHGLLWAVIDQRAARALPRGSAAPRKSIAPRNSSTAHFIGEAGDQASAASRVEATAPDFAPSSSTSIRSSGIGKDDPWKTFAGDVGERLQYTAQLASLRPPTSVLAASSSFGGLLLAPAG